MSMAGRWVLAVSLVTVLAAGTLLKGVDVVQGATGDSPGEFGEGTLDRIAVLSSDPRVQMGLTIEVHPRFWSLHPRPIYTDVPRDELPAQVDALIVVPDGWHFDFEPFDDALKDGGMRVSHLKSAEVPWLFDKRDLQLIEVPFSLEEFGYASPFLDIPGVPGPSAQFDTTTGRRIIVPTIDSPLFPCANRSQMCPVAGQDLRGVASNTRSWYGWSSPTSTGMFRVVVRPLGEWRLVGSNPAPAGTDPDTYWEDPGGNGSLRSIDMEIVSTTRIQTSQRALMWRFGSERGVSV